MRRPHDQYFTPASACEVLKRHWDGWKSVTGNLTGLIEPCVGEGDIVNSFIECDWFTCDIDSQMMPNKVADMSMEYEWYGFGGNRSSCVITNPPFKYAYPILRHSTKYCDKAAFLLRLSFLEPTRDRGPWLAENPPDLVIVLPRISFTGDGKTDSVTCAWMIWDKTIENKGVIVSPKTEPAYSRT